MLVAAVHESVCGTKRKHWLALPMSAREPILLQNSIETDREQ
jgi:hypothetical protein